MKISRIISIFIQTVLFIAGTLIIITGTNLVIRKVFSGADKVQISVLAEEIRSYSINKPIDTKPITAIYAIDRDNMVISHIVLEIMDCENHRLTYVSIPCSARLTINDELYRELTAQIPQFPQVVTLSECCHYCNDESGINIATKILTELTGVNIPYSISLPTNVYESVFLAQESKEGTTTGFALPFTEKLSEARGGSVYDILTELNTDSYANITLQDKLLYLETYDSIMPCNVVFSDTPGTSTTTAFNINEDAIKIILYGAMYGK